MPKIKCAVYVRKSTEHGLEQEFNSLLNQEESCKAYIASKHLTTGNTFALIPMRRFLVELWNGLP